MNKKESEICEFEIDAKKSFCLYFTLSNHDIISALRPGLKTSMDFRCQVWKRVWKMTFFGLKQGQDLENQAAQPHQKFPGVPPGELS